MNIEPHNLIDPLREKLPHLIRHEKLYRMIHRQLMKKWFQYFVLFFIIGSICSIIYSSFEESAPYHNILYAFNYLASFIFTIEYGLRIVAAPVQYASCNHAWKARLRYLFSFYGLIDFVAIIPFMVIYVYKETPHVHLVVLAYVLIIFKLIRYSRSFQMIGTVLRTVREELVTAYTACGIMLGFSGILMYYIERYAQPEAFENIGDGFWWAIVAFTTVGYGDIYPITPLGRLLSSIISLIGIAMIAIPAGINKQEYPPMHTCEHIINRTMVNLFGCGRAVSAHIERKKSKLDFALSQAPSEDDIARIETTINEVIARHLPVTTEFITQEEATGRFDMKRLPEGASETVRVVHVGDYDECLCIGQHVENTSEIGTFKIISHDFNDGIFRMRFKLV